MTSIENPNALRQLPNYAASPHLTSLAKWRPGEVGHVLVDINTADLFILVGVVQVYDYKLNCGPNGNFIKTDIGSLEKAKFQFYVGRPAHNHFGEDFPKMYTNLAKLQDVITATKLHKDMLHTDASAKMIRFAHAIFKKRDSIVSDLPPTTYYEDVVNPKNAPVVECNEKMDDETRNWPVEEKYRDALHLISPSHKAVPLRTYNGDTFVEPNDVNSILRNALIEVHFSLHHTFLTKQSPPHDTFRANIEQIIVLKPGKTTGVAYSKTDIRSGPISALSFKTKRTASSDASSSRPTKITKPNPSEESSKGKGKQVDDDV